jgi:RND family efflux transporter MFP subunit
MRGFVLALLVLCSCSHKEKPPTEPIQSVKCTTAKHIRFEQRDFAALTTADDAVNLAFKISGRVVDIPIAKGQQVKRGELLAELDKRDVELQVNAAKASYTEALQRLERGQRLIEHNAISKQEYESLQSSAEQAKSTYENSLDLLADTRILAPFDGIIERTYVDTYERVSSGQTIVRLVNPISTTVGFTAPESLIAILDLNTTHFEVEFDAWPKVRFEAKIKSFARTSSDALGFPVSLRLVNVDNDKYKISPGMTCIAIVITPERNARTMLLPLTAIYAPLSGGEYVWVIDNDNRVHLRKVEINRLAGSDSVEVVSGIEEGENVVTAGVYKLHNNQEVRIIE